MTALRRGAAPVFWTLRLTSNTATARDQTRFVFPGINSDSPGETVVDFSESSVKFACCALSLRNISPTDLQKEHRLTLLPLFAPNLRYVLRLSLSIPIDRVFRATAGYNRLSSSRLSVTGRPTVPAADHPAMSDGSLVPETRVLAVASHVGRIC